MLSKQSVSDAEGAPAIRRASGASPLAVRLCMSSCMHELASNPTGVWTRLGVSLLATPPTCTNGAPTLNHPLGRESPLPIIVSVKLRPSHCSLLSPHRLHESPPVTLLWPADEAERRHCLFSSPPLASAPREGGSIANRAPASNLALITTSRSQPPT